jgi:hypothetical protein
MVLEDPHDELPDTIHLNIADDVLAVHPSADSMEVLLRLDWEDVTAFETGDTKEVDENEEMSAVFEFLVAHSGRYRMRMTHADAHILNCCFITRCEFLRGTRVVV